MRNKSELDQLSPPDMVNKYSNVKQFFNGRIVVGPKSGIGANFIITVAIISIGGALFQVNAYLLPKGYYMLAALSAFYFVGTIYNVLAWMYTDPGILVRPTDYINKKAKWEIEVRAKYEEEKKRRLEETKKHFEDADKRRMTFDIDDTPIQMNETLTSEKTDTSSKIHKEEEKVIKTEANGSSSNWEVLHIQTIRFWGSCQIYRPPLSSHCNVCNNWVKGFDHHCVVTNWCIGERNLRNFVLSQFFVGTASFIAIYGLFVYYMEVSYDIKQENGQFLRDNWINIILWQWLGYFGMGMTIVGAIPCWLIGTFGFVMAFWNMIYALSGEQTIAMNIFPYMWSTSIPVFLIIFCLFFILLKAYYEWK